MKIFGINIHEDLALSEVVNEAVIETASTPTAVVSPVADEDFWHRISPCMVDQVATVVCMGQF